VTNGKSLQRIHRRRRRRRRLRGGKKQ